MKKIKGILVSSAVILSVTSVFATRPYFDCSNNTQYYFSGGNYNLAGKLGVNYVCTAGSGTCTYYTTNGQTYYPCQAGIYCASNCLMRLNLKH